MEASKIPHMITISKAAELTGVSYSYIRNLCLTRQIVFVKTGCKYLVNLEKLVEFFNGEQCETLSNKE